MTIKTRNRFNFIFTITAIVITCLQLLLMLYQFFNNDFSIPNVYFNEKSSLFIFKYKPIYVIIGIFLLDLYVIGSSIFIHENFEKTQSTEIIFFLLFLIACLCDSLRLLVPLFKVTDTYSRLLMQVAYLPLFARILAPLSFLGITILSDEEAKFNVNRNCVFIIITALFFAKLIPFNTAIILPNFCVSYGYTTTLQVSSFFICIISTISSFVSNKKNGYDQKTSIGILLLALGYSNLFYCYNLFHLIIGTIVIVLGTILYLKTLHKQYLWLD